MEKLILIDGNSLINRAFYAMPLLTTKDGIYTNAVYGFLNMLFRLVLDEKPSHIAVAFDVHAPTFRHNIYSEYKGTRKPMPEELRPQIPLLKELLSAMNICCIEKAGFEADDIIGTIAKNTDLKTIIVTGDRDSFQLVDESTSVYFTKRGISDTDVLTFSNFKEKTGITPKQVIDLKSLMGDTSDNIKGVSGIGEKTALSLLETFGSSENLYEHVEELSGKLKEKIILGKDDCFLSKTLATIKTDCDINYNLDNMKVSLPLPLSVKKRFIELEFKSLYKKEELFISDDLSSEKPKNSCKQIVLSSFDDFPFDNLSGKTSLVVLEESVNLYNNGVEYKMPIRKTLLDDGFELSFVLDKIRKILQKDDLIVYDKKTLNHHIKPVLGITLSEKADDLAIIKYVVDFTGDKTLSELILEYDKDEKTPAFAVYDIYCELYQKLSEYDLISLYNDVELPLSEVLFSMEESGFKVDEEALNITGEKFRTSLKEKEEKIKELGGDETLNVNSPKQLGELLFEKLRVGKGKKTKLGYSTSAEILEGLEDAHPIIPLILEYRKIQKLYSTYIEGFKPLINKKTGLIHTSFNQTVTATGRLSSSEPNLQNIPVRDEEGKELRKFFVPKGEDRILIGADYSQIELRLLAAFSNTQSLIDAFKTGKDIHSETASKVFKIPLDKVTKTMRSRAKAVNFGVIYGISEYGLAKQIKTSNKEAKEFIDSYFKEYPEVKKYMDGNVSFAREHGYSITMLNRRRYIRDILSSNYNLRSFGERVAMNMPLQGSAADVIKLAMLGVYNRLKKEGLKSELILQIHDELIIDAYLKEKEQVEKILKEEMEGAVHLSVKLSVELGSGKNWYEAK